MVNLYSIFFVKRSVVFSFFSLSLALVNRVVLKHSIKKRKKSRKKSIVLLCLYAFYVIEKPQVQNASHMCSFSVSIPSGYRFFIAAVIFLFVDCFRFVFFFIFYYSVVFFPFHCILYCQFLNRKKNVVYHFWLSSFSIINCSPMNIYSFKYIYCGFCRFK